MSTENIEADESFSENEKAAQKVRKILFAVGVVLVEIVLSAVSAYLVG